LPTSRPPLGVTIQAQILHLMKELSRELGIAMVVITNNRHRGALRRPG
jgi:ABC-type dipeptide/oligopeptide/nickel transport system ATPase component